MMYATLADLAGFVGGLVYSRGKADPVHNALFDAKRLIRSGWRLLRKALDGRAGKFRQARPSTHSARDR